MPFKAIFIFFNSKSQEYSYIIKRQLEIISYPEYK